MADRRLAAEERAEEDLVNETLTLQDDQQHADLAVLRAQIDELNRELFLAVDNEAALNVSERLRAQDRDGASRARRGRCICFENVDAGTPGTLRCAKCGTTSQIQVLWLRTVPR